MKKMIAVLLSVYFLTACEKNNSSDDDINPPVNNCRVVKISRINMDDFILEYDNQNRLVKTKSGGSEAQISYTGNTITYVKTSNGNQTYTLLITTNSHGLATNVRTNYPNGNWSNDAYEYNGTQVIRKTYTNQNNVTPKHTLYQWVNGNPVRVTEPNGTYTSYTWNENELFQQGDYFGLFDFAFGYSAVRPKNRIKSLTTVGGILFEIGHSEDSDGKVKTILVNPSSGSDYQESVSYDCN